MKLLPKFFLPVIISTLLISVVVGYTVSNKIKQNALKRAQIVTADYINTKAHERLSPANFQDPDFFGQYETFEVFMGLITTKEIIKIKVFNADDDIIFSTSRNDIGQKTDSKNYKKALTGQIATNIKAPIDEAANIDIAGYKQVMEVYVPILYDNKIVGIIETYYKMDFINEDISETTKAIVTLIVIYALAILVSIYLILKFVIINPVTKLKEVADQVSNGDLNISLPHMKSKDEIRDLNEALKGMFAAIEFLTDEVKDKNEESRHG